MSPRLIWFASSLAVTGLWGCVDDGDADPATTAGSDDGSDTEPELHPLEGYYTEVSRIPCDNGPEFAPSDPVGELFFTAAGDFGVTWSPFETYVDYWGTYVHDLDTNALTLSPTGGNYEPDDVDGQGSFSFEGEQLILEDIWLGSSFNIVEPPACGHRFE